jgi:hypothetical protein
VIGRALLGGLALALVVGSSAHADGCPATSVDVADWPIVRSARVPGFTLRLPRTFTRDSVTITGDSTPSARWSDAVRGRLTLSRQADAAAQSVPGAEGRAEYARCDARVGSATATIVSYGQGANAYVIHAQIRWPDGEAVDVRADAADRAHFDQLLAALRTIRRAGA